MLYSTNFSRKTIGHLTNLRLSFYGLPTTRRNSSRISPRIRLRGLPLRCKSLLRTGILGFIYRPNSTHEWYIKDAREMSWWTRVLLTASSIEDMGDSETPDQWIAIDHINQWLNTEHAPLAVLFTINGPETDTQYPPACFAGYFKSLHWAGFIAAVKNAPWVWPEQVQLFMADEDDNGFQEIPLGLDPLGTRKTP